MTTISATIIADSINERGNRLTTFQLRYPRWIHAEGRTHRQLGIGENEFEDWGPATPSLMADPNLSRNASSSRAIPVSKLIQDVLDDPAVPLFWGANQKGMQAGAECDALVNIRGVVGPMSNEEAWLETMARMIECAQAFDKAGYHKQIVNRLLEPFSHINVVCSATEWTNFYGLRRHDAAEPHIHLLADRMWEAQQASTPRLLKPGQWHLPYVRDDEISTHGMHIARMISVARCASVSYKTVDGFDMTAERAVALFDKLVGAQPIHASPAEHQGYADYFDDGGWVAPEIHGNFKGFVQLRKTIPNELIA